MTPDRFIASGGPSDPASWNRYSYTRGDPINRIDPHGLADFSVTGYCYGCSGEGEKDTGGGGGDYGGMQVVNDGPAQRDTGGGQTAPPDPRALLSDAVKRAQEALESEKCQKLFGNKKTRENGFDPATVLGSIADGGTFGRVTFTTDGDPGSTTANGGIPKVSSSSVIIALNTANWDVGNTLYNAETLLHELGHAYDIIHGSGGSVIKSPDDLPSFIPIIGGSKRSLWNDWKVDQDCFGGALGYKKP